MFSRAPSRSRSLAKAAGCGSTKIARQGLLAMNSQVGSLENPSKAPTTSTESSRCLACCNPSRSSKPRFNSRPLARCSNGHRRCTRQPSNFSSAAMERFEGICPLFAIATRHPIARCAPSSICFTFRRAGSRLDHANAVALRDACRQFVPRQKIMNSATTPIPSVVVVDDYDAVARHVLIERL